MRARWLCLLLPLAVACGDSPPTAPDAKSAVAQANGSSDRLVLMTQNMYVGTDVDTIIAALASPDPTDDFPALQYALGILATTDFPSRSAAIADAIATHRPHVVGLQEVSVIEVDIPGVATFTLDFLPILLAQLQARGLDYVVAGANQNFVAAPIPGAVSLTDSDVMLVDADRVDVTAAQGHTFQINVPPIGALVIERGYVVADLVIDDREYRVVTAHTEPDFANQPLGQLRAAQAAEIAGVLGTAPRAVVMGDLNDEPGSLLYDVLVDDAELLDVWAELRPGAKGFTAPHPYTLDDRVPQFDRRIDHIMVRGIPTPSGRLQGSITLFGDHPSERVAGSDGVIWPSDHAGVIASLLIPAGVK